MAFTDLREFISKLEEEEELHRITTEVDWNEEVGAASRYTMDVGGPALLFENIKDYPDGYRILGSLMGPSAHARHARFALAMGVPKDTPPLKLIDIFEETRIPYRPFTTLEDTVEQARLISGRLPIA